MKITAYITAQIGQLGLTRTKIKPINIDYEQLPKSFNFDNPVLPIMGVIVRYINYCGATKEEGLAVLHGIKKEIDKLCEENPLE